MIFAKAALPIVVVVFAVMLLFPIVGSYVLYRISKTDVLFINADKTKDPRFFAKSFRQKVEHALERYKGGNVLHLSRSSEPCYFDVDRAQVPEVCDRLFVSLGKSFDTGNVKQFESEIYTAGDAIVRNKCEIRAMLAKGSAVLGNDVVIDRWVDAEGTLSVHDNCDLGVSASSPTHLIIGRNCIFRRLYAPVIDLGVLDDTDLCEAPHLDRLPFRSEEVLWDKRSLDDGDRDEELDDAAASDEGVINASALTKHSIKVVEHMVVAGDIRSNSSVRLCDDVVVYGNVFGMNGVVIGERCRIFGTVFSQEEVIIGEDTVIGVEGQLRSVVSRGDIIFEGRAKLYGYVSTEGTGRIVTDEYTGEDPSTRPVRSVVLPKDEQFELIAANPSAAELEHGALTYRKDLRVGTAVIPAGLVVVPRSLFYECRNLKQVDFPATLSSVDKFAFFHCTGLTRLDLAICPELKAIGASAFEGCENLREVIFPPSITEIGEAAFRNCKNLERIVFWAPSALQTIGSHAFMGCTSLESILLPEGLLSVGMSAFYGCSSLKGLTIPSTTDEIGAYLVAECGALSVLSLPRPLQEEEEVGMPDKIRVIVRGEGVEEC